MSTALIFNLIEEVTNTPLNKLGQCDGLYTHNGKVYAILGEIEITIR